MLAQYQQCHICSCTHAVQCDSETLIPLQCQFACHYVWVFVSKICKVTLLFSDASNRCRTFLGLAVSLSLLSCFFSFFLCHYVCLSPSPWILFQGHSCSSNIADFFISVSLPASCLSFSLACCLPLSQYLSIKKPSLLNTANNNNRLKLGFFLLLKR